LPPIRSLSDSRAPAAFPVTPSCGGSSPALAFGAGGRSGVDVPQRRRTAALHDASRRSDPRARGALVVLECGSPLPLWYPGPGCVAYAFHSGGGPPHSTTLRAHRIPGCERRLPSGSAPVLRRFQIQPSLMAPRNLRGDAEAPGIGVPYPWLAM
jgi:hypothetical protein